MKCHCGDSFNDDQVDEVKLNDGMDDIAGGMGKPLPRPT